MPNVAQSKVVRIEEEWHETINRLAEASGLSVQLVHSLLLENLLGKDKDTRISKGIEVIRQQFPVHLDPHIGG